MDVANRLAWRDRLGAPLRERRTLAALELLIVPIVLGLRAAGAIRNPVIVFLRFGWLSLWLRRSGWRKVGLSRPTHWPRTILAGISIGIGYNVFDIFVLLPLIRRLTGEPLDLSELSGLPGN